MLFLKQELCFQARS